MRYLLAVAVLTVFTMTPATASADCPQWLQGGECWAPVVTYQENTALLHDDPPAYVTKIEMLAEAPHFFDTRAELVAYVQDVLMVKGFWFEHPTRCDGSGEKCLLVPPSAFDHVELRQIVHARAVAQRFGTR